MMKNESYKLALVWNYCAAHGVDFNSLSQTDQKLWTDKMEALSHDDDVYLDLIFGICAPEAFEV